MTEKIFVDTDDIFISEEDQIKRMNEKDMHILSFFVIFC